ncbi:hypothetical protein LZ32DRAFT_604116 [Colletotrichum eremochloae]|nr:hypothetical protein LZ32DRAFT_604116 [Colletotrichum eremochloae]
MVPGENKTPPVKYHTLTLTPLLISVGSITVLFTSLASQDCVAILHNWEYFTYPYYLVFLFVSEAKKDDQTDKTK